MIILLAFFSGLALLLMAYGFGYIAGKEAIMREIRRVR